MNRRQLLLAIAVLASTTAHAHGPSPQKVIKEWTVHAAPAQTWALVKDFAAIGRWNPAVAGVEVEERDDPDSDSGGRLPLRVITLKDGGQLVEKLRETNEDEMKVDIKMVDTSLPISNYRSVMQVKAGPGDGESTITWTARFYNKANSMEAKPGEDNKAAVAAINAWYDAGVEGFGKAVAP